MTTLFRKVTYILVSILDTYPEISVYLEEEHTNPNSACNAVMIRSCASGAVKSSSVNFFPTV